MNRDKLTKAERSYNMSRINSRHTSPELAVRRMLHGMGYRFRLHVKIRVPESMKYPLPRRVICPDIVLRKLAIIKCQPVFSKQSVAALSAQLLVAWFHPIAPPESWAWIGRDKLYPAKSATNYL